MIIEDKDIQTNFKSDNDEYNALVEKRLSLIRGALSKADSNEVRINLYAYTYGDRSFIDIRNSGEAIRLCYTDKELSKIDYKTHYFKKDEAWIPYEQAIEQEFSFKDTARKGVKPCLETAYKTLHIKGLLDNLDRVKPKKRIIWKGLD